MGRVGKPDDAATRHLWAFRAADAAYILESAPDAWPGLTLGKAKHTNLTGGADASCGGELWLDLTQEARIYVNGASGRYGPRSRTQLEDAVDVFRAMGFEVISYGWNDDTGLPWRVYFRD